MKKLMIKLIAVSLFVLLLPFLITLLFENKRSHLYSMDADDFRIYYDDGTQKEFLDFEDYLVGVVASQMPAGYNTEALKAQAVIARTYTLYNLSLLQEQSPGQRDFTTAQLGSVYITEEEMRRYWGSEDYLTYISKIENAVSATKNQILTYQGNLILPLFFLTGSGQTRSAKEAWGIDIPYLVPVESKQDLSSTHYLRIEEYALDQLINDVNRHLGDITLTPDNFFDTVQVSARDKAGYVTAMQIGETKLSGEEFSNLLGLSSNHFYIEDFGDWARIVCTGVGHGLGLSQYGANAMAGEGMTYDQILIHYYSNVELVTLKWQK